MDYWFIFPRPYFHSVRLNSRTGSFWNDTTIEIIEFPPRVCCPHFCTVWNYRTSCSVSFWPNLQGSVRSITVQILRAAEGRADLTRRDLNPVVTVHDSVTAQSQAPEGLTFRGSDLCSSAVWRPDGSIIQRVGGAGFEPASSVPRNTWSTNWATPPTLFKLCIPVHCCKFQNLTSMIAT